MAQNAGNVRMVFLSRCSDVMGRPRSLRTAIRIWQKVPFQGCWCMYGVLDVMLVMFVGDLKRIPTYFSGRRLLAGTDGVADWEVGYMTSL